MHGVRICSSIHENATKTKHVEVTKLNVQPTLTTLAGARCLSSLQREHSENLNCPSGWFSSHLPTFFACLKACVSLERGMGGRGAAPECCAGFVGLFLPRSRCPRNVTVIWPEEMKENNLKHRGERGRG